MMKRVMLLYKLGKHIFGMRRALYKSGRTPNIGGAKPPDVVSCGQRRKEGVPVITYEELFSFTSCDKIICK